MESKTASVLNNIYKIDLQLLHMSKWSNGEPLNKLMATSIWYFFVWIKIEYNCMAVGGVILSDRV